MEKAKGAQGNPGGQSADTVRQEDKAAQAKTLAGLGLSEGQSHRREKLTDVSEDQVGLDKPAASGIIAETLTRRPKRYDRALQRAVKERLEELDRNPFEAARIGGLERSFVYEILSGRKRSVRGDNLARLARALDWDSRLLKDAVRRSSLPKGLDLGSLSPPNEASLDLFDVNVLRIGFSAILLAAGVSPETARQLIEGLLEFARRRRGRADYPPSPDQAPTPDSDAQS